MDTPLLLSVEPLPYVSEELCGRAHVFLPGSRDDIAAGSVKQYSTTHNPLERSKQL